MAQRSVEEVKENIEKLYAKGAGKEDILGYIEAEGYTPQQLKAPPAQPERSMLGRAGDFLSESVERVWNVSPQKWMLDKATAPSEDLPEFGASPYFERAFASATPEGQLQAIRNTFTGEGVSASSLPASMSGLLGSDMAKEYGVTADNVDQIRWGKDEYGNDLVVFPNGKRAYLNKPGLSFADVDMVQGATERNLPLLAMGGAANAMRFLPGVATTALGGGINEASQQQRDMTVGSRDQWDMSDIIKNAGYAATGEAGGRMIAPAIGAVIGRALGRQVDDLGKYLTPDGKFTDDAIKAMEDAGVQPGPLRAAIRQALRNDPESLVLSPEQMRTANELIDAGYQPTRANLTQNVDDWRFQMEAGKGDPAMVRILDENNRASMGLADDVTRATGRTAADTQQAGGSVIDAVSKKATDIDGEIASLYRAADEAAQATGKDIQLDGFISALRKKVPANQRMGGAVSAIKGELMDLGVINNSWQRTGRVNAQVAEEIRKRLNAFYDPNNGYANTILRDLKDQLDDDVLRYAGQDVYDQARALKRQWHQEFTDAGASRVSKWDTRTRNILGDILEGRVKEDRAISQIVYSTQTKADELARIRKALTTGTPEQVQNGTRAWNDIRGQVLADARKQATSGAARTSLGDEAFSPMQFFKYLDDKVSDAKMKILFTQGELDELARIRKLYETLEPKQARGTTRSTIGYGPTSQAVSRLKGWFARVIERAPAGRAALAGNQAARQTLTAAEEARRLADALAPTTRTQQIFENYVRQSSPSRTLPPFVGGLLGGAE